jgi:hypothetical protein
VKPATTAGGQIIGNRNSKTYHLPNCPDYSKVSERNRVSFKTEAEVQAAGVPEGAELSVKRSRYLYWRAYMGTDWLQLFDKSLSDKILAMNRQRLVRFLEENIDVLKEIDKRSIVSRTSIISTMNRHKVSLARAVGRLIVDMGLQDLKIGVAFDFCFGEEWVYLDYWGCYAHVFDEGDPKGSIQSDKYLPDKEDYGFLLLTPDHVDRIVKSLEEHADDLPVMKKAGIERVEYFRDFCRGHPGYWVAYKFDY